MKILSPFLFLLFATIYAQDTVKFKLIELDSQLQFQYYCYRVYYKNDIFDEVGILGSKVTYRIKNNNWYTLINNKWEVFYKKNRLIRTRIEIGNIKVVVLQGVKRDTINNTPCILYEEYFLKMLMLAVS